MDSYTVRTGDSFGLHGGGFQPGEQVRVYLSTDPGASLGETQADSQGVFALSGLRLPGRDGGDRTITVEGQSSGLRVERTAATVAYSPWVRLNQYAVKPGESVGFSGYDFAPGEQVQLLLDGNQDKPLAEAKANDRGEISNQSVLTTKPADVGTHRLTFAGQTTHSSLDVQFEVLGYTPEMELSSYAGWPGAEVAFEGKGFAPGEAIRAYMHQGQKKTQVATFQADAQGVFSQAGEFRVPENAVAGPLPLTVEGDESKSSVGQTFTVDPVAPWVGLSSYSGPAGTKLTAQTKGFGADETVNVYLNDSPQPVASGQTDLQGATESGTFSIPEDAGPSVTVVLRGQGSGAEGRATFSVNR